MSVSNEGHATHADIVKRLKRAIGQLQTVVSMIEAERACTEIAMQLHAAEKAIVQAKKTLIHDHIDHCLDHAPAGVRKSSDVIREFREISKYL